MSQKFKIGLVMIVKNEAQIINRCLESTVDLIDAYSILDTGSTDNTKTLIPEILKDKTGKVHSAKWSSFGEARTQALALANEQTDVDWWLMLDADMTIEFHPDLKNWLRDDAPRQIDMWMVELVENAVSYRLPLLVKGGHDWHYVGATHEYLDPTGHQFMSLLGLSVYHLHDSINRADKFERDIKLLQPEFDAGDPRATYYTAESLRGLGRVGEALAAFDKRAEMGGFEEEAWHAQYMAAKLMLDIDPAEAAKRLVNAFLRRPTRAEPLYHLINWCGARYPEAMPLDALFQESWIYQNRPPTP